MLTVTFFYAGAAGGDDSEKYNPSEWVQNLINNVKSEGHKAHSIFSELDVLKEYNGGIEWRETARSVKFISGADPSGFGSIQRGDRVARGHQVSKIHIRADPGDPGIDRTRGNSGVSLPGQ